uniref:Nuclear protein MDM1 n=1 Tax=Caenorhabditis tropicalis TaxID=1561998 RepID=A0A1I7T929_9PELO
MSNETKKEEDDFSYQMKYNRKGLEKCGFKFVSDSETSSQASGDHRPLNEFIARIERNEFDQSYPVDIWNQLPPEAKCKVRLSRQMASKTKISTEKQGRERDHKYRNNHPNNNNNNGQFKSRDPSVPPLLQHNSTYNQNPYKPSSDRYKSSSSSYSHQNQQNQGYDNKKFYPQTPWKPSEPKRYIPNDQRKEETRGGGWPMRAPLLPTPTQNPPPLPHRLLGFGPPSKYVYHHDMGGGNRRNPKPLVKDEHPEDPLSDDAFTGQYSSEEWNALPMKIRDEIQRQRAIKYERSKNASSRPSTPATTTK